MLYQFSGKAKNWNGFSTFIIDKSNNHCMYVTAMISFLHFAVYKMS